MINRREQLEELRVCLSELAFVLAQDPSCQWRKHFAHCEQDAASLLSGQFTQSELNQLSGSITHVYGGAGSFTDYAPIQVTGVGTFKVIAGMEQLAELSGKVHSSALALRVIGNAP
jgi:hypothetical protein